MEREQFDFSDKGKLLAFTAQDGAVSLECERSGVRSVITFGTEQPALWPLLTGRMLGRAGRVNEPGQVDLLYVTAVDRGHGAVVKVEAAGPADLVTQAASALYECGSTLQHVLTITADVADVERQELYERMRAAALRSGAHVWTYQQDKRAGTLAAELLHTPDFRPARLLDALGETLAGYQPVLTPGGLDDQLATA